MYQAEGAQLENVRRWMPDLADAAGEHYLYLASLVEPTLLELCRLRMTQIIGNSATIAPASALQSNITADQLDALPEWRDSDRFDAIQKACLDFTEYFCHTAQSVTDEHVARLSAYLTAEQILGFTVALWVSESFHRLSNFLAVVPTEDVKP
jgi:hypothetical protein